jgi:hypothetical protein
VKASTEPHEASALGRTGHAPPAIPSPDSAGSHGFCTWCAGVGESITTRLLKMNCTARAIGARQKDERDPSSGVTPSSCFPIRNELRLGRQGHCNWHDLRDGRACGPFGRVRARCDARGRWTTMHAHCYDTCYWPRRRRPLAECSRALPRLDRADLCANDPSSRPRSFARPSPESDLRPHTLPIFITGISPVLSLAGCGNSHLTPPVLVDQVADTAPAWSPDGLWIASAHCDPSLPDTSGLYLADTTGAQALRLTTALPGLLRPLLQEAWEEA